MDQSQENDPRSAWERLQSRSRFRWLVDKAAQIATAWETRDNGPLQGGEPSSMGADEPTEVSDEALEQRRHQRRQEAIVREGRLQRLIQIAPGRELDVLEYGRYRRERADWLTMEIGPGNHPSGVGNRSFTDKSAYIGIENYSFPEYSDEADAVFAGFRESRQAENIFLRSDPTFGKYYPKEKYAYYDFPDGTADEVYLSQVYDKPSFDLRNDDEEFMTNEVARLLKPGGKALIFDYDRNLESIAGWLDGAGLELRFLLREEVADIISGDSIFHFQELREVQAALDCTEGNLIVVAEKPLDWTRSSASKIHAPFYPAPAAP
ncbi:MAG TPA: hypothetical protein VHA37_03865 [Candidatus Saccharimonadales bacterium]|nr:hypothetical protein [Candidatus Saccharimonadales bacterium]